MNIDKKELKDLAIATLVISFIFAYEDFIHTLDLRIYAIWLIIVLLSFVVHELAHKYVAIHYGHLARFEISYLGLAIALFLKVTTNTTLIIPGAVMIYKHYRMARSRKEVAIEGVIAFAGPLTNLTVATLAGLLIFFGINPPLLYYLAYFNAYLALFNLLPIPPLDGFKIIRWSYVAEGIAFVWSLILLLLLSI